MNKVVTLTAAALLAAAPVAGQQAQQGTKQDEKPAMQGGMMNGMSGMMEMCRGMMGEGGGMMGMHKDGGMGGMAMGSMMGGDMMNMAGPAMILGVREALALTDDQVAALEALVEETHAAMGAKQAMGANHAAAAEAAQDILDDAQKAQLQTGLQLMHGMMRSMMGSMMSGKKGPGGMGAAQGGHESHHR